MNPRLLFGGVGLVLVGIFATSAMMLAQDWKPPPPDRRCPSQWGAADERGAANHMQPETVMRATRLIKEGKIYELGRVLAPDMPLLATRSFLLHTARSSGPSGTNQLLGNEETVVTQLGHVGTQLDGLSHIGIGEHLYNCVKADEVATRAGFSKLGIEKVGAVFTRGVLLDIAAVKDKAMVDAGYEITVADLERALQRQNVRINAGDAVLLHTGWGKLWMKDSAKYNRGQPGLYIAAGEWLAKQSPLLVGADNWGIEVRPHSNKDLALPVHQIMVTVNGIFLLENMDLEALARDRVYEFAFIVQPLKLKGGTGSTVAPIAVK
jgi:kynurenine formamidase